MSVRFYRSHGFVGIQLLYMAAALALGSAVCRADENEATDRFAIPATDDDLPGEGPMRREDWFQKVWRERRTHFAERAKEDQDAVVFFGDSITQGWSNDFRGHFKGLKLANRGISGDTTRGMLWRLEEDVLSINPKAVVMLMGTNDLADKAEPKTIVGNIKRIVKELKKHDAKMPVIVCQVMPSSSEKDRPADKIREINRRLAEAIKHEPQATVLETWTLFANDKGDAKPEEFPDLLHPNDAGYAKWAAALRPLLATHGFLETEPDDFKPEPGFELLFNGKDLTGWRYRPTPEKDLKFIEAWKKRDENMPPWPTYTEATSFDGKTESNDGRYAAENGRLTVKTPSEGRRIQQLWTTREFDGDFMLRLEFRATPNADSGVFIREPQLQCRDYGLAGPYKNLKKYKPQQWNELEVVVTGKTARATCNGEVLEEKIELPESGPIGLEGDRGQMEYRRIRVRLGKPEAKQQVAKRGSESGGELKRVEDVIYGRKSGVALTMDVITPEKPNGLGVILVVSGGWYSAHEAINPAFYSGVANRGYTVFAVVHGSQPKFAIPEILSDLHRSVRFIRHHAAEYKIDPDRLGIMGGSAGGHLSLMQGTAGNGGDPKSQDPVERESSRVQAVACFFPPTDFLNYGKPGNIALGRGTLRDFRGAFDFQQWDDQTKHFEEITDEAKIQEIGKQISPITHVSSDDPPTLIIHGDADTLVPIQQAELVIDKLKEVGVHAELVVKPGAGHGWGDLPNDLSKFADWFDEHLKEEKE